MQVVLSNHKSRCTLSIVVLSTFSVHTWLLKTKAGLARTLFPLSFVCGGSWPILTQHRRGKYLGNIVEGLHADIKFERFMLLGLYIMTLDVSAWAFEITWLTMVNRPNCRKMMTYQSQSFLPAFFL